MTPRQKACLDLIEAELAATGCPPSYAQIRDRLGLASSSGVARLLDGLEEQGRITRRPNRARSIELTATGPFALLAAISTDALRAELARREAVA